MSPLLPFAAVVLLSALWALSDFGGWAHAAFCSSGAAGTGCRAHLQGVLLAASWLASAGLTTCVAGVLAPLLTRAKGQVRRTRLALFTASALFFVIALAIVFVGGELGAA